MNSASGCVRLNTTSTVTKLTYQKREIAIQQLETAIRLFQERKDPFSVITLAAAAEEILGRYVEASGKTNSLQVLRDAALAIQQIEGNENPISVVDRANYARNNLKHLNLNRPEHCVFIDEWQEAEDMLARATDNYWLLENCFSPLIEDFLQQNN